MADEASAFVWPRTFALVRTTSVSVSSSSFSNSAALSSRRCCSSWARRKRGSTSDRTETPSSHPTGRTLLPLRASATAAAHSASAAASRARSTASREVSAAVLPLAVAIRASDSLRCDSARERASGAERSAPALRAAAIFSRVDERSTRGGFAGLLAHPARGRVETRARNVFGKVTRLRAPNPGDGSLSRAWSRRPRAL